MSTAPLIHRRVLLVASAGALAGSVRAQTRLQILCGEEPPNNFLENGQPAGIVVDLVQELGAMLGAPAPIQVMPWTRAYALGMAQPDVALFTMGRTQERVDLGFQFVGPVVTRQHGLYTMRDDPITVDSLAQLRERKLVVGVQRDDWREGYMRDAGVLTEAALKHEQNVRKLVKGRYRLIVLSDLEAPLNEVLIGLKPYTLRPVLTLREAPSFIGFSRGTPAETVVTWRRAMDDFAQSTAVERIAAKWSARLGRRLQYSREHGFRVVG